MRADIAFSSDDSHRFLPWLIGMMVTLAALLLCFVVTINGWVVERNNDYTDSFTVNIPVIEGERSPSDDTVGKAIALIEQSKGVASVSRIAQSKLQDMLVPWLGSNAATTDLPLPAVLDVGIKENATVYTKELQTALAQISPNIEVDTHEAWVAAFMQFSSAMRSLIMSFAGIIIIAIGLMIAFTSRASLHLHSKAVSLLHSVGAEDGYIASQFQREAFGLTLRGAFIGCIIAAAGFWGMGLYISSLGNASIPSMSIGRDHVILLFAIPFICAVVALMTARFSVMAQLKNML